MKIDLFNGWTPRVSQKRCLESRARHIMVGGPVGPGKTAGVIWKMVWLMINYPRNFGVFGRWSEEHLWTTSIPSIKELFPPEKFDNIIRWQGGDKEPDGMEVAARDPNKPEVLSWDYKSVVKFVPLSVAKRLPGGQYGFFVVEQAEQCPDASTWVDLTRRMRLKCVPYPNRHGLGTANYEENWDWINDLFIEHHIENRPISEEIGANFEFIEAKPEETDQNFGDDYRKEQMALLPPVRARALILGENVRTIGRIFKTWNEEIHVKEFEFADVAKERGGLSFVIGYDYGMSPDPTAIVFIGVDGQGRLWVRAEHVLTDTTVKDNTVSEKAGHESLARAIAERIGFPLPGSSFPAGWDVFGKQSTGLTIADEWSEDFPWHAANCDVAAGLERLNTLLVTRPGKIDLPDEPDLPLLIVHPDCENLRYAMSRYKYDDKGTGKPLRKQAPGVKDLCDSLRYACMDAITPRKAQQPKSSANLTSKDYDRMVRAIRRGQHVGNWIPVVGGRDPALPTPKRIGPAYERPLGG